MSLATLATSVHVVHESACPEIGPICAVRDEPAQIHDQKLYVAEIRPSVAYGLTEHFGLEAQLPFKLTKTNIRFRRLGGEVFEPDYASIHHRNETVTGIADPELGGRASWRVGTIALNGHFGASLPLGKTEENPFARGRSGLEHQHIQLGTGTVDPYFAVDASRRVGSFEVQANARAKLVLYENAKGFRAGNRYGAGLRAERAVVGRLHAGLGFSVANEQPERWDGRVEQDGNLGRTDYLASASLSLPLGDFSLSVDAIVPVYQHLIASDDHDPGQLSYPAIFRISLGRSFKIKVR